MGFRIGFSKDIHRLVQGRKLILGGIVIPFDKGEQAHSDGDVLLHAIAESILGALALNDLGTNFPDNDPKYKDISSVLILKEVKKMMEDEGYSIVNIDASIALEKPKLQSYIEDICDNVADILDIESSKVSIKAMTNEGMGEVGKGEAVEAYAITLLSK